MMFQTLKKPLGINKMSFLQIFAVITLALIAYTVLLLKSENSIIFHPSPYPEGDWDPSHYDLMPEDVNFEAEDGTPLHGWYFPRTDAHATLLWFHGNAGNISHRLDNIQNWQGLNINVFIFDYRGYGKSRGTPDETGIYLDSQAAYDYLIHERKIDPRQLILFGRSLGGICAAKIARTQPSAGLILESTFTSAKDMAKEIFPILPIGWALRSKLNAKENVAQLTLPKLFLHGTEDEIVPYTLGQELYSAAKEPKDFYSIKGAGHNDTYSVGGEAYLKRIDRFIHQSTAPLKKD
jgi:uncharacterized protein